MNNFEDQVEVDAYGNAFTISLSGEDSYGCVKTGVTSTRSLSGGTKIRASDGLPADDPMCVKVNEYCSGAGDRCQRGEGCPLPDPSCTATGCPAEPDCTGACGHWDCSEAPQYGCRNCYVTECEPVYECDAPCDREVCVPHCEGDVCWEDCMIYTSNECPPCNEVQVDTICEDIYYEEDCDMCGDILLDYSCTWNWICDVETCGHNCWEETKMVYDDVKCDYNYFGTAALKVMVSDQQHEFPVGAENENLALNFYVASGNPGGLSDLECEITTTDDDPDWQWCKAS